MHKSNRFFPLCAAALALFATLSAHALTTDEAKAIASGDTEARIAALDKAVLTADDKTAAFIQAMADDAVKYTEDKVFVTGMNVSKKHKKQQQGVAQAGIIEKEMPMPLSKVMLVCKSCNKPVRVGFITRPDGKHRVCRSCGQDVD